MGFNININESTFKNCLNRLKILENDIAKEVDMELASSVEKMATLAKQKAPVDTGRLRSSINVDKMSLLRYRLIANTNYAAYVEFGTGDRYKTYQSNLDDEWRKIAKIHYVNGKGITRPQPFFYPSVKQEKPFLFKRIQSIILNRK